MIAATADVHGLTVVTRNVADFKSFGVAMIDAKRLDHYHRLEQDRVHLLLLDEVEQGLVDVVAGRTGDALEAIAAMQSQRSKAKRTGKKAS